MNKKYTWYFAVYAIVMLAITVLGTVLQFNLIGVIMPIWNLEYSPIEAYASIAFAWLLLPCALVFMADDLRSLQELEKEETSDE